MSVGARVLLAGALLAILIVLPAGAWGGGAALRAPIYQGQEASLDMFGTPGPAIVADGEAPGPTPIVQSPEDALAQDIALVADALGWTIEEATANYRAAEIVGNIAGRIAAERPDIFIGSALSPDPLGPPSIYIKGPADEFVRNLVAAAEIEVKIIDNQAFSLEELEQRQRRVVDALLAQGFQNLSAGIRIQEGGLIEAVVTREPGLPDDPAEILAALPPDLRGSVSLTVSDAPVGLELRD